MIYVLRCQQKNHAKPIVIILITSIVNYFNGVLTLALAGEGNDATPLSFFLRCTPNYEADRAEILHSLQDIFAQLLVKKIDRVMSGHGAMTSQEVRTRSGHFLRKMADYCTLEGDIDHDEAYFD